LKGHGFSRAAKPADSILAPQGTNAPPLRCLPESRAAMHSDQGVSRRLIGEAEHFWKRRYYDFNVRNEPQFVEKLPNSVIPTGTGHRKAMICGVEGPCV
jgi:hypothetical protein